jgi:hypothetical protein
MHPNPRDSPATVPSRLWSPGHREVIQTAARHRTDGGNLVLITGAASISKKKATKRSRDPAGAGAAAGPAVRSRRSQWTQRRT